MGNFGGTEITILIVGIFLLYRILISPNKEIAKGKEEIFRPSPPHTNDSTESLNITPSTATYSSIPFNYFLEISLAGRDLLLQDSPLTKKRGTNFEAMLFTSTYILRRFRQVRPNLYKEFEEGYINEIYAYTQKQKIIDYLPDGFKYFFAQRFKINSQEIDLLQTPQQRGFVPLQSVVYNLYDEPLTKNGSFSHNLAASLELTVKMPHVFKFIDDSMSMIIQDKNL